MLATSTRYSKKSPLAETGLNSNAVIHFTAQSPLGYAGGDKNLYRYVQNSPLTHVDPRGLETYSLDNLMVSPFQSSNPHVIDITKFTDPLTGRTITKWEWSDGNIYYVDEWGKEVSPGPISTNTTNIFGMTNLFGGGECSRRQYDSLKDKPIEYKAGTVPPYLSAPQHKHITGFVPGNNYGTSGALPCITLAIKCSTGTPGQYSVAIFHFQGGDSPSSTLRKFRNLSCCHALIAGGQNGSSEALLNDVFEALIERGATIDGYYYRATGCGVTSDGKWWIELDTNDKK